VGQWLLFKQWVGQWLLLNAKGAMFQQNHGGEETDANFIILGPPIYHEYELRWEVITRLDDIGRIVDHQCLNKNVDI
jgi:hypothetical protein